MRATLICAASVLLCAFLGNASEADALAVSAGIQAKHMPFGTLMDPIYASSTSDQIVGYTRCGDSALWTGAYLAAEAFRYRVTQSAAALRNVKGALAGLKGLTDVTGDNRLARCMFLAGSPYAAGVAQEESANGVHQNAPWIWVGNTSRDQVVGAFFGLATAFDMVDDAAVKAGASDLITRLIGYISRHQWSPRDDLTSTFQIRAEELQMLLQVARHVNPANTVSGPFLVPPVSSGIEFDVFDNGSYFKFNLDYMSLYQLLLLQNNGENRAAYATLRSYTRSHQNAFFNMLDRALAGPDPIRDAETRTLLEQWLDRPRRDFYVDLSSKVAVCGSSTCRPIPVPLRSPATFLWEVDPFQLTGGGSGIIESSGVDYILPYWMARYYGVIDASGVQSSATSSSGIAPGSLGSLYGQNLATASAQAVAQPLPLSLAGVIVAITDSAGVRRVAPLLYVSPGQINFMVPDNVAPGEATISVTGSSPTQTRTAVVQTVAPALFSMSGTGTGVAAALAVTVQAGDSQSQSPTSTFQCTTSGCVPMPITLAIDRRVYVSLYGTGIRDRSSLSKVIVTINGFGVPALYAGAAPEFSGLDQVNVALPLNLRGSGECNIVLTVDGQASNAVRLAIR